MFQVVSPNIYGWLTLAGIVVSIVCWSRVARRDARLPVIYVGALLGAFFGAKVVYVFAEGWQYFGTPDVWRQLATGKTILGALLGGYGGVELLKRVTGYTAPTGDWFAIISPIGIMLGRVGCWLHGCCLGTECPAAWFTMNDAQGTPRWPAVPVEVGFNLFMLGGIAALRWRKKIPGQHFHVYLIAYGVFRFGHEFLRDTPRLFWGFSGYQFAALAVAALGWIGYRRRSRAIPQPLSASSSPPTGAP